MESAPLTELQEHLAGHAADSRIRPVEDSMNGEVRFLVITLENYHRLRRGERVAGRTEHLDFDTLEAIRAVEPGKAAGKPKRG